VILQARRTSDRPRALAAAAPLQPQALFGPLNASLVAPFESVTEWIAALDAATGEAIRRQRREGTPEATARARQSRSKRYAPFQSDDDRTLADRASRSASGTPSILGPRQP
jgi:hypothetical protein